VRRSAPVKPAQERTTADERREAGLAMASNSLDDRDAHHFRWPLVGFSSVIAG
jgi:hypothetical protein